MLLLLQGLLNIQLILLPAFKQTSVVVGFAVSATHWFEPTSALTRVTWTAALTCDIYASVSGKERSNKNHLNQPSSV